MTSSFQVLDFPAITREGRHNLPDAIFLDEFRIMVTTRDTGTNAPGLTVYNTLLPQDHPMNSRRFSLPPRYHDRDHLMLVDQDRPLGALKSDGPLITDPTQAILVVELLKFGDRDILLVVRTQVLIEHACSTRADVHIPWNEWGRGAVVMESPLHRYRSYVHGTHLAMVLTLNRHEPRHCVRTFDFSRHGCGDLPLWDDKASRAVRVASLSEGTESRFEYVGGFMGSHGDGGFFQVSYLSHSTATLSQTEALARCDGTIISGWASF